MPESKIPLAEKYEWDYTNKKSYNSKIGAYKTKIELDFILSNLKKPHSSILDIGGGSGRFAEPLIQRGHKVIIIDKNSIAVSIAQSRGITAFNMEFMNYYSQSQVDAMLAIESMDYIEDKQQFFKKVRFLLDAQGIFIFTIPNPDSWRYKLRQLRRHKHIFFHSSYDDYINCLEQAGFIVKKVQGFMWMPFKLNSNHVLIPLFIWLEKYLNLKHCTKQSPWLLIACSKAVKQ